MGILEESMEEAAREDAEAAEYFHRIIRVRLLDTATGRMLDDDRHNAYFWTEGNGSCDCNRALDFFPEDVEWDAYLAANGLQEDNCFGPKRFLVIWASDLRGYRPEDFNKDYPRELVAAHPLTL